MRVYTPEQLAAKREYSKRYHAENKDYRNGNAIRKRLENKLKAIDYMGGRCQDCGGIFPHYTYDFHHLDPSVKEINVGNLLNWNWGRQKEELDKCIMVCANCHRERHHGKYVQE